VQICQESEPDSAYCFFLLLLERCWFNTLTITMGQDRMENRMLHLGGKVMDSQQFLCQLRGAFRM
jgi:hypothetical protein